MVRHHRQADVGQIKHKPAGLPGSWESQPNPHSGKGWVDADRRVSICHQHSRLLRDLAGLIPSRDHLIFRNER